VSVLVWAVACAVCATADPTLSAEGEAQPYRGRLRLDLDVREGRVAVGSGQSAVALDDHRAELAVLWAPVRVLALELATPFLFRHIDAGRSANRATLGDVELRARFLAYEARGSFGVRRFGLLGALTAPTAPLERDPNGVLLASTLEPGCGSLAPTLGAYFTQSRGPLSVYASGSFFLPFSVRDGPHAGDSLRLAAHVQWQPTMRVAGRIGVFARIDASGQLATNVDDPNSGGFVGYVTGELVVSPVRDLVITAGVLLPVIEALRGAHRESAISAISIGYDF
jgi:hypothetical protein